MKHVSLLPPRIREERLKERRQATMVRIMIAFFILVLIVYAFLFVSAMLTNSSIKTLRFEREALEMQVDSLQPYSDLFAQMNQSERRLNQAMGTVVSWNDFLLDLGSTLTPGTWLENLSLIYGAEEGTLRVSGFAFSHDNISELVEHLNTMEQLEDVLLQVSSTTEQEGQEVISFTLEAALKPGEPYLEDAEYTPQKEEGSTSEEENAEETS